MRNEYDEDGFSRTIAKATSVSLFREDHGILTLSVGFDYGDKGAQGLGLVSLDVRDPVAERRVGVEWAIEYITSVMEAFGVDALEKIKGRTVYVLHREEDPYIAGLEPLPTERGTRVVFSEMFDRYGVGVS